MSDEQTKTLVTEWKQTIYDQAKEVDPSSEQDWYSMALGWGIGKGLSVINAHALALHIRHKTPWG